MFTADGFTKCPSFSHVFHKVLNLVLSVPVNDWAFQLMILSPVTNEAVYPRNVPNRYFWSISQLFQYFLPPLPAFLGRVATITYEVSQSMSETNGGKKKCPVKSKGVVRPWCNISIVSLDYHWIIFWIIASIASLARCNLYSLIILARSEEGGPATLCH